MPDVGRANEKQGETFPTVVINERFGDPGVFFGFPSLYLRSITPYLPLKEAGWLASWKVIFSVGIP